MVNTLLRRDGLLASLVKVAIGEGEGIVRHLGAITRRRTEARLSTGRCAEWLESWPQGDFLGAALRRVGDGSDFELVGRGSFSSRASGLPFVAELCSPRSCQRAVLGQETAFLITYLLMVISGLNDET